MNTNSTAARSFSLSGLVVAVVLGGVFLGMQEVPKDKSRISKASALKAPATPPGKGPLFVLSGNEKGFIRPCGCSKPALGGIHRRSTWINRLRAETPALQLISTGDLIVAGGQQQRLKFETFLMSMDAMGYVAYAPGAGEFRLGVDYLRQMTEFASFPLVGLNIYQGEQRFFKASAKLENSPWHFTGLVASLKEIEGVAVKAPADSLKTWLDTLDSKVDRVLVAFSGTKDEAIALAKTVSKEWSPHVIIAIGGAPDQPTFYKQAAPVRMVSVGSKGRFLAYLRPNDPDHFLNDFRLEEEIEEEEVVGAMLNGYRDSLAEEKLIEKTPRAPGEIDYVGESRCVECHKNTCKILDDTPHERAWATLVASNDHHDPECARCHVTGWGQATGFFTAEKTPNLVNVTCEACHGPGDEHASLEVPTPGGKVQRNFCLKCHDADNSPNFDYDKYWPKIAHPEKGKK